MSILKRSASLQAPTAESKPESDRLRVITAGRVGNIEVGLGASGFDVVAVAATKAALIVAVSSEEPDAIVVDADLSTSLEHVRDLAPDAALIAVGDHTPAGALGRIERGVSGTVMARLLHALVAEGVGGAAVWGFVPAFGPGAAHSHRVIGILSAKADLVRAVVDSFRDHAELVTAASTVAVTVSASLVLMTAARWDERPQHVSSPSPVVEPAPQQPAIATASTTPEPAYGPSWDEGEPGNGPRPNRGESSDQDRHNDQGEKQNNGDQIVDVGSDDQIVDVGSDDQSVDVGSDDQDVEEGNDDQGKDKGNDDQGKGKGNDDQDVDESNDDQDVEEGNDDDQDVEEGNDDQDVDESNDDQDVDESNDDQDVEEGNDDQDVEQGSDDQGET